MKPELCFLLALLQSQPEAGGRDSLPAAAAIPASASDPGDIPVMYPPKISSVVDIDMKGGSFTSVNSSVGAKLTGGLASVEGPALGSLGSFALAGRYVDFSALRSIIGDEGIPRLGDAYAKLMFLLPGT